MTDREREALEEGAKLLAEDMQPGLAATLAALAAREDTERPERDHVVSRFLVTITTEGDEEACDVEGLREFFEGAESDLSGGVPRDLTIDVQELREDTERPARCWTLVSGEEGELPVVEAGPMLVREEVRVREDTKRPGDEKAEFERIAVGLIEATDLLGETINGYKIDEAAEWLKVRGFLADDEPDPETLAGLLYAVEGDAVRDTEQP